QEYDYKKEQVKIVEKYHSSDTIRALLKKNKMMIVDVYGYKDRRFDVLSDEVDNLKLLFVAKKL
ncbi:MAG: hypothetical protein JXO44_07690, partial [Clostridia bacterium]|nr:hypothetical protein [Clostridia bacterium]